ncbi:hypothetical protein CVS48_01940 [Achromobacter spanius]|nr:hypothetical protein CVS48_01940 [Achromobacter spanius]
MLPPEGGAFCLGAARRQKWPPRRTRSARLLPPEGAAFCLGAARRQKLFFSRRLAVSASRVSMFSI